MGFARFPSRPSDGEIAIERGRTDFLFEVGPATVREDGVGLSHKRYHSCAGPNSPLREDRRLDRFDGFVNVVFHVVFPIGELIFVVGRAFGSPTGHRRKWGLA